jgi:transcriptional regulator with XRE-family HTH domain
VNAASAALGARIREVRMARGWSQKALGDALWLSQGWVSNVESGRRSLTDDELKQLSDRLNEPRLLEPVEIPLGAVPLAELLDMDERDVMRAVACLGAAHLRTLRRVVAMAEEAVDA